jgi:hypothetical protein
MLRRMRRRLEVGCRIALGVHDGYESVSSTAQEIMAKLSIGGTIQESFFES